MAMFEVTARTTDPWSTVAYIVAKFPSGAIFAGSGTVVGPNDVLTATHLLYRPSEGGWATQIHVYPGADTVPAFTAPYGDYNNWRLVDTRTVTFDADGDGRWEDSEAQYDIALIGLNSRLGNVTGWTDVLPWTGSVTGTIVGYPALGTGMMAQDVSATDNWYADVFDVPTALGVGSSGGPLLTVVDGQTYVVGVASGVRADGSSSYAQLSGDGTWEWLLAAMARNDALLLPAAQTVNGNAGANQLPGTNLDNQIWGNAGNDVMTGGGGNDLLVGGAGVDTAAYSGGRADYSISRDGPMVMVSDLRGGGDGTDTVYSTERFAFADCTIAYDLQGNAGAAAKVLGAVCGASSLADRALVGSALAYLDRGFTELQLMEVALTTELGAARSDASVINLLCWNVFGHAPSAGALYDYTVLLATGQLSQAALGVEAAESSYNADNINLAGLAAAGLAYDA